jgi:hypothetical protein
VAVDAAVTVVVAAITTMHCSGSKCRESGNCSDGCGSRSGGNSGCSGVTATEAVPSMMQKR